MYKRDRALKQQAIRHQQQILASCQMRMVNGMTPLPSEDIKPDPVLLQQIAANAMSGFAMGMSPMSSMPSPTMPDSPPADYSRVSMPQSSPRSSSPSNSMYSSMSHHSQSSHYSPMAGGMRSYSPPSHHPMAMPNHHSHHNHHNHHNHHHPHHNQMSVSSHNHHTSHPMNHNQLSPVSPLVPPVIPIVPQLIIDMKNNVTDEEEIKHKLVSFVLNEYGGEDIENQPLTLLQMLCKLSDQLLFLMVEWARNCCFFKELKVGIIKNNNYFVFNYSSLWTK